MAEATETKPQKKTRKRAASRKRDEDPVGKVYDSRLMRRLARYVNPYWLQATVWSLSVCIKSFCDVMGPIMTMVAIDRYLPTAAASSDATHTLAHWLGNYSPLGRILPADAYRGITELAAIFFAFQCASYFLAWVDTYLMQWMGQKVMFDLRREIFRHMQRMHVGFFDANPVGRLVTRLTSDVDAINDMFTDGVLAIVTTSSC
jgi:ATP-binding cassette subfamily B protein